jgi:endonuclease/exonuclease/phosphatase (EEP) superfamily protein YafD
MYALLFSKATGVFFVAMAAINAAVVLPLYLNTQEPAINDESMTIVSFNVEQRASIRDLTFRWVDSLDADLVVLLDSTDDWARSGEMTDVYTLESQIPIDRTFGITILSQEGLDTELLRTTQIRDSVVRVEASIGDEPIAIYAVQARSSSNETDAGNRDDYLAEVGRMVNEETIPAIIVGDFQATPWSHAFRDLTSETGFKNSLDSYGLQTTWPADRWAFFRMPLDHLLHSETLTTIDRYLGPVLGVDHRPIVVTVGLAS